MCIIDRYKIMALAMTAAMVVPMAAQTTAFAADDKEITYWNIAVESPDKDIVTAAVDKFNKETESGYTCLLYTSCIEVGSLSRRGKDSGNTTLQICNFCCYSIICGVLQTGIEVSFCLKIEELSHFISSIIFISGTLINRECAWFTLRPVSYTHLWAEARTAETEYL